MCKSRFTTVTLTVLHFIFVIGLFTITVIQSQWMDDKDKMESFLGSKYMEMSSLISPIQVTGDIEGRWGWSTHNTVLRLITFVLLSVSVIVSWVMIHYKQIGLRFRRNLSVLKLLMIIGFCSFCIDIHCWIRATSFCNNNQDFCGSRTNCHCIYSDFWETLMAEVAVLFTTGILFKSLRARSRVQSGTTKKAKKSETHEVSIEVKEEDNNTNDVDDGRSSTSSDQSSAGFHQAVSAGAAYD